MNALDVVVPDLSPDFSYQKGGASELPAWVPFGILPVHAESLCAHLTEFTRDEPTHDLHDLFSDEQRVLAWYFGFEVNRVEIPL